MDKRCYSVAELQEILGVSRQCIYELLKKKEFSWVMVGGKYRISKKSFDEWLDQNQFRNARDREKVRDIVEGSMRMPEMARMLGVSRSVVYNIIACSDILKTIEFDGRRRVTKKSFYEWYASQNRYHIVSEQVPETVKKEDNRSIETYRRAVQDRDGHTKNIGNGAYLTVKEAALLAGINPATVHKWIKKGKIEAVQSSKTVRIPRQAFENWLQSRKKEDQHGINC